MCNAILYTMSGVLRCAFIECILSVECGQFNPLSKHPSYI